MPIRAILFDLDDTLIVDEAVSRAALEATAQHAFTTLGASRETFLRDAREHAKRLHAQAPVYPYCRRIGISAFECLWGKFLGNTADLTALREWAQKYRVQVFEATLRSLSEQARAEMAEKIELLATSLAEAHGLTAEVEYLPGYPVTVNDEDEYAFAKDTIVDVFGPDRYVHQRNPEMGSEDFAFVGQEVPSAYVNLSACPAADFASAPDNHSPRADFDDSVVPDGAALLAELALRRLRQPAAPGRTTNP